MIAVIDDGVNSGYYGHIGELSFNMCVDKDGHILPRKNYNKLMQSHGTTCAAIIKKYAPQAEIGSIKIISNSTMRGKILHLISALEWCENNDIKIIHMSIGSKLVRDIPPLKKAVDRLNEKGCIIVAALSNNMKFSAPASLDGVIGVKTDLTMFDDEFKVNPCGLYDVPFVASSLHSLVDYNGNSHTTQQCNSYAAPVITAKICSILTHNPLLTRIQIVNQLGLDAMPTYTSRLVNTEFIECTSDVPIITISGTKQGDYSASKMISQLFTSQGYPSMVFCDGNMCIDDGVEQVPESIPADRYIGYVSERLDLSGAFLITDNQDLVSKFDARIIFSLHGTKNRYSGDDIFVPQNYTENNIKNAVKRLIQLGG